MPLIRRCLIVLDITIYQLLGLAVVDTGGCYWYTHYIMPA